MWPFLSGEKGRTGLQDGDYRNARAPGTQANRACHLRQYQEFCAAYGVTPWPVSALAVGRFLQQWADRNKSSKVEGIISTLRTESQWRQQPFDDFTDYYLSQLLRGLKKEYRPSVRRKLPFTLDRLERVAAQVHLTDPWHLQALTVAYVAHDGLFRACELLELRWEDLSFLSDGTAILNIKVSKTTYTTGEDNSAKLPTYRRHGVVFCGASLLSQYYTVHHSSSPLPRQSGYLFADAEGQKLKKNVFVDFMQSLLVQAGVAQADL